MPRFKSRSSKIQPCSNNGVDATMVFTKVMPNLAVFGKTKLTNDSYPSHPELKFNSKKTSKILSRMDDPEEVFEFSPAPSGFSRHSVSLPICNTATTLHVTPGRFSSCRSSVDFSQLHTMNTPSGLMDKESSRFSRRKKIFEKCDVWSKLETRANESDLKPADHTNDNKKPWQNIDKITDSEVNPTTKDSDILEWTANPEKCYRCILSFKQERSSDSTSLNMKNTTNHQPLVVHDLEDCQRISFSPEVLVFSAVENNLQDELEAILTNSKIELDFCFNSKNLTPLHLTAQLGFTQCAQVLLKYGCNVNCLNSDNHSPLYLAFTRQHYECAILLIEAGADIQQFTAQKINEFKTARKISQTYKRTFVTDV